MSKKITPEPKTSADARRAKRSSRLVVETNVRAGEMTIPSKKQKNPG